MSVLLDKGRALAQLIELGSLTAYLNAFRHLNNLIDEEGGVMEQRIAQITGQALIERLGFEVECIGLEGLDQRHDYAVVCSHASYLDWAFLLGYFPLPVRFIAKRELVSVPVIGHYLKHRGVLIDRKAGVGAKQAIAQAVAEQSPWPILIFPEGTRSPDGEIHPFKVGGLRVLIDGGLKLLPLTLCGTFEAFSRHATYIRRGGTLKMIASEMVEPAQLASSEVAIAEVEQRVRQAYEDHR